MTTVKVIGPYTFWVTSDVESVEFENVRFEISGGAELTFDLANNEDEGTATFTGVTSQVHNSSITACGMPRTITDTRCTLGMQQRICSGR